MNRVVKRIGGILLLVTIIIFGVLLYIGLTKERSTNLDSTLINKHLPSVDILELKSNKTINTGQLSSKKFYLLNVWASWCQSCYIEHSYLLALKEKGIRIVGINYKDEVKLAWEFLNTQGDPYQEVLFDPQGKLAIEIGLTGVPETYLVSPQNKIIYKHIGVMNDRIWQKHFISKI